MSEIKDNEIKIATPLTEEEQPFDWDAFEKNIRPRKAKLSTVSLSEFRKTAAVVKDFFITDLSKTIILMCLGIFVVFAGVEIALSACDIDFKGDALEKLLSTIGYVLTTVMGYLFGAKIKRGE